MMQLSQEDLEVIRVVYSDILYLARTAHPSCTDDDLRRISVQLRGLLLNEARIVRCWKLLGLGPKQPIIIAPRLQTGGFDDKAVAISAGGQIGETPTANVRIHFGKILSEDAIKANYERGKENLKHEFPLSEYMESCAIFARGQRIKRRQVVAYVANKKGGAHLDRKRKKDEEAYMTLDTLFQSFFIGGNAKPAGGAFADPKNFVLAELLSIGQHVSESPDIRRLVAECKSVLGPRSVNF